MDLNNDLKDRKELDEVEVLLDMQIALSLSYYKLVETQLGDKTAYLAKI